MKAFHVSCREQVGSFPSYLLSLGVLISHSWSESLMYHFITGLKFISKPNRAVQLRVKGFPEKEGAAENRKAAGENDVSCGGGRHRLETAP